MRRGSNQITELPRSDRSCHVSRRKKFPLRRRSRRGRCFWRLWTRTNKVNWSARQRGIRIWATRNCWCTAATATRSRTCRDRGVIPITRNRLVGLLQTVAQEIQIRTYLRRISGRVIRGNQKALVIRLQPRTILRKRRSIWDLLRKNCPRRDHRNVATIGKVLLARDHAAFCVAGIGVRIVPRLEIPLVVPLPVPGVTLARNVITGFGHATRWDLFGIFRKQVSETSKHCGSGNVFKFVALVWALDSRHEGFLALRLHQSLNSTPHIAKNGRLLRSGANRRDFNFKFAEINLTVKVSQILIRDFFCTADNLWDSSLLKYRLICGTKPFSNLGPTISRQASPHTLIEALLNKPRSCTNHCASKGRTHLVAK